jgi:hypothetical protein
MTLPAWIVLGGGKPRWPFACFRVIAGPTMCRIKMKAR